MLVNGEDGRAKLLILDMALKMNEADYTGDYPYWRLSLRHFFMADLGNVCIDQVDQVEDKKIKKAKISCEQALRIGSDSTVYNAMIGYAVLLGPMAAKPSKDIKVPCKTAKECSKKAYEINPHYLQALYNYALLVERNPLEQEKHYLRALEMDPRYVKTYKQIIWILHNYLAERGKPEEYERYWDEFAALIKKIAAKFTIDNGNKRSLFHKVLHDSFNKVLSDDEFLKKINPSIIARVKQLKNMVK